MKATEEIINVLHIHIILTSGRINLTHIVITQDKHDTVLRQFPIPKKSRFDINESRVSGLVFDWRQAV
jgi:hypothetical protein